MKISEAGLELVRRFEGLRLEAYLPTPEDVPTIGYGHTKGVQMGDTCTREQAEAWLLEDIAGAERTVNTVVRVALSQGQFDALTSFEFNTGALRGSTLLRKINSADYAGAAEEFDRWVHQGKKVLPGLVARRAQEKALFQA